jgi:integrase
MSRPRKGSLEPAGKSPSGAPLFRFRLRLADGTKSQRFDVPEGMTEKHARAYVAGMQADEDTQHGILNAKLVAGRAKARELGEPCAGETCDAWYERFKVYRQREVGSVDDDSWRWTKWIAPHIGPKAIRDVTPDDVEDIRDALTEAVLAYEAAGNVTGEGRLAPKTAQNVWAALTTPMKYASTRKGPRELRAREDLGNPCLGIPPPRDGVCKRRHWLRPSQWSKLIAWLAPRDRAWADAYAVGLYLHLRPGELHELRVRDLDLVAGEVRIARAYDERTKSVTTPKTDEGIRTVTIPATLLPLLERIAREGSANDRVCPVVARTPEKNRAGIYREFLQAASVDEPAFFVETATHLRIDFRSVRDSGITWRFLAGERAEVVQREAGHEHISTTLGYAKEVQDRRGRYGEPFPALPAELCGSTPGGLAHSLAQREAKAVEVLVGEAGFEPATTSTQSLCTTGLCDSPETKRLFHSTARRGLHRESAGPVALDPQRTNAVAEATLSGRAGATRGIRS